MYLKSSICRVTPNRDIKIVPKIPPIIPIPKEEKTLSIGVAFSSPIKLISIFDTFLY